MRRKLLNVSMLLGLLWMSSALGGQSAVVQGEHLSVQLLASEATVAAGTTTLVGVRLQHEPHWHTYWANPGDSGIPTRLKWQLPQGVTASDIDWPAPHRIPTGPLTNFGYDGDMLLPVRIALPPDLAPGSTLPLAVKISWLVCQEECIPGDALLELSLPIAASAVRDPRLEAWFATARATQPEPVSWRAQWRDAGDDAEVLVEDGGALQDSTDIELFPPVGTLIAHTRGAVERVDGALRIRTPKSDSFVAPTQAMPFLLASTSSGTRRVVTLQVTAGTVPLPPAAPISSTNEAPQTSVLLALGFALMGGLLLNLMPCVLPVLSLKALSLAQHAHQPRQARRHGLSYCAGALFSFLALAGTLLALRAAGQALGWGFQLQTPTVVAALAMLMTVMGLSLSGMFELGASWMGAGQTLTEGNDVRGAFFSGVLAAVVASPCTAPFMGPALGFAITQPAPIALGVFAALALGLSLPIVALSFAPALARWLPRPGAWMVRFKQVMAYPLYLTAVWLLWVLGRQAGPDGMAVVLVGLVVLVFGLWLWSSGAGRLVRASALFAMIAAVACLLALRQLPNANAGERTAANAEWQPWTAEALQALRAAGKPVLVNMTAAWCITCLANERVALSSPSVQTQLRDLQITYLKGDWTQRDAAITDYLSQFGRNGVPLYAVYPRNGGAPEVLPQVLTPDIVAAALQRAGAGSRNPTQSR